jgi:hypothetical protein
MSDRVITVIIPITRTLQANITIIAVIIITRTAIIIGRITGSGGTAGIVTVIGVIMIRKNVLSGERA